MKYLHTVRASRLFTSTDIDLLTGTRSSNLSVATSLAMTRAIGISLFLAKTILLLILVWRFVLYLMNEGRA